ncbi:hypothetical protein ABH62_30650, partial [Bacillus cereus]
KRQLDHRFQDAVKVGNVLNHKHQVTGHTGFSVRIVTMLAEENPGVRCRSSNQNPKIAKLRQCRSNHQAGRTCPPAGREAKNQP